VAVEDHPRMGNKLGNRREDGKHTKGSKGIQGVVVSFSMF
jgi:hypothetical protein